MNQASLPVGNQSFVYFPLTAVADAAQLQRLPYSIKILLENLLRFNDGVSVTDDDVRLLAQWTPDLREEREIAFTPSRVVLQDFTGVPCVVDLAAMRDAMAALGGDP
ncbi:MAG: aconitase family protein, partial [Cardiobacteriaceae bacterium]|nr:aconitase family protein [Cardiobacteriaceae bacterium]